jgi:hypothetical protein
MKEFKKIKISYVNGAPGHAVHPRSFVVSPPWAIVLFCGIRRVYSKKNKCQPSDSDKHFALTNKFL